MKLNIDFAMSSEIKNQEMEIVWLYCDVFYLF